MFLLLSSSTFSSNSLHHVQGICRSISGYLQTGLMGVTDGPLWGLTSFISSFSPFWTQFLSSVEHGSLHCGSHPLDAIYAYVLANSLVRLNPKINSNILHAQQRPWSQAFSDGASVCTCVCTCVYVINGCPFAVWQSDRLENRQVQGGIINWTTITPEAVHQQTQSRTADVKQNTWGCLEENTAASLDLFLKKDIVLLTTDTNIFCWTPLITLTFKLSPWETVTVLIFL